MRPKFFPVKVPFRIDYIPRLLKNTISLWCGEGGASRPLLAHGLHLPYPERLENLQLPTLEYRRKRADLIQTYKILRGLDKLDHGRACQEGGNCMFRRVDNRRTRGHSWKLYEQHQLGKRKAFFPARVTALWNRLKSETVEAPSVNSFKAKLKKEEQLQAIQYCCTFSY